MPSYKLTVAYDGSDFNGWQMQNGLPSIAQKLQNSFKAVFCKKVAIIGASRTDAGVHALGQVVRVKLDFHIKPGHLMWAWNNVLPPSIIIRASELVDDNFHPMINVQQKIYHYNFTQTRPAPFGSRYLWYVNKKVNIKKLEQALQIFVGKHDFRSFATGHEMYNGTVRTIESISLNYIERYDTYRITFKGPGFLRHMIRRIVGAAIFVAIHDHMPIDALNTALQACNARQALPTAPAHGLTLYSITYKGKTNG